MADERGSAAGPVRPAVALALATVAFIALVIFGFGMVSLFLNADVIEEPGLGQIPGVFATTLTGGVFALVLWLVVRLPQPRYRGALSVAVACYLAYAGGIWLGVLMASAEFATATDVAGRIAATWFGLVVPLAAAVSAVGGIALVRTRSERPRWPWEDEFDE